MLTKDLDHIGYRFWNSIGEMDEKLRKCHSQRGKLSKLKIQLKLRENVIGYKEENRHLCYMSKQGNQSSSHLFLSNLKEIIKISGRDASSIEEEEATSFSIVIINREEFRKATLNLKVNMMQQFLLSYLMH